MRLWYDLGGRTWWSAVQQPAQLPIAALQQRKMAPATLLRLVLVNAGSVGLFYGLYSTENPKPYSNMAFFLLMGCLCYFYLFPRERVSPKPAQGDRVWVSWSGSCYMVLFFLLSRVGYWLIQAGYIPLAQDNERWVTFSLPWLQINSLLSVLGILLVVVTLEWFYRVYTMGVLERYYSLNTTLLLSAFLSSLRGFTLGIVPGLFDFSLSLFWGRAYLMGGLRAAILVHLVWDLLFIYVSP